MTEQELNERLSQLDALHDRVHHMTRTELEAERDSLNQEYEEIVRRDNGGKLSPETTLIGAKMGILEQQIDFLGKDDGPEIKPVVARKPFII